MAKKKKKKKKSKPEVARAYYPLKEFKKHKVIAAYSTRRFKINFTTEGNSALVVASRKLFCRLLGIPFQNLVCLEQVHGSNIVRIEQADAGRGARILTDQVGGTDAVITNVQNIALSIRTADCAPVFFLDPVRRAVGLAHIGWRGAMARLATKVVQALRMQFLSKPEDLMVAIGPTIRPCCYEVGSEFQNVFGSLVTKKEKSYYFDLPGWIKQELTVAGVPVNSVEDTSVCTACENKEFPSYRKEGSRVRPMMSVISLTK